MKITVETFEKIKVLPELWLSFFLIQYFLIYPFIKLFCKLSDINYFDQVSYRIRNQVFTHFIKFQKK